MRIIDWSSDVCASDLPCGGFGVGSGHAPPSSIPCRAHLCYNSVGARHGIVVHEVENAHERAMERCVNLTALLAGMQHNLADERADVGCRIEPRLRVFERFGELGDLALVNLGNAGMEIGRASGRESVCQYV